MDMNPLEGFRRMHQINADYSKRAIEEECTLLRKEKDSLTSENNALKKSHAELQSKYAELERRKSERKDFRECLGNVRDTMVELRKGVRSSALSVAEVNTAITQTQNVLQSLEKLEVDSLNAHIKGLMKAVSRLEYYQNSLSEKNNVVSDNLAVVVDELVYSLRELGVTEIFPKIGTPFKSSEHESVDVIDTANNERYAITRVMSRGLKYGVATVKSMVEVEGRSELI